MNSIYYGVSSDSLHRGHQLEFKTDTTFEISTFPRHMSRQFKMSFNYNRNGNIIRLVQSTISQKDSQLLSNNGLTQFLKGSTFVIDKKAIVDTESKIVYVLHKDFSKRYYLTYLIDGNAYRQETGLSDAYGLVKNNPKENKALKDKLASIDDHLDQYVTNVYRGLEAYSKFGYESVFGVIEFRRKD